MLFVVQSLGHVRLFATPRTAACQASPSFTIWSLRKLTSIESLMPSNHLILFLLLPSVTLNDLMELPSTKFTLTLSKDKRSTYQVPAWHTVGALQMVLLFSQGPLLTECRKHAPPAVCTSPLNPMLLPPASQNNCLPTVLHSNGRIRRESATGFPHLI